MFGSSGNNYNVYVKLKMIRVKLKEYLYSGKVPSKFK
jgi:hypothetical protein